MENKKILIITPTHNIIWTLLHAFTMIMANFNTSLIRRDTFFIMLDEDSNISIVNFVTCIILNQCICQTVC